MSSNSSVINIEFLPSDNQTLIASVVNAGPTATTLALSCPSGTSSDDCGYLNSTLTIGAWAQPSSKVTNGTFDLSLVTPALDQDGNVVDPKGNLTYHVHCEVVSKTLFQTCTGINEAYVNGTKTTVTSTPDASETAVTLSPFPFTITAGAEQLAALATTTGGNATTSNRTMTSSSAVTAKGSESSATSSVTKSSITKTVTAQMGSGSAQTATKTSASSASGTASAALVATSSGAASASRLTEGSFGLLTLLIAFLLR